MKRPMYSVYDSVAEIFNKPFPAHNDADAIRVFEKSIEESGFEKERCTDYSLFRIGVFDDNVGEFLPEKALKVSQGKKQDNKMVAVS